MNYLKRSVALLLCVLVSGCQLLCQAGTGTCGMSREQAERALHPKAYGEYWTKPGMTKESWRQDWVACGGMADGGYSSDAPSGSPTDILLNAAKQKQERLGTCMKSKKYSQ